MFSARLTNPHRRRGKRPFEAVVVDEAQDVGIPSCASWLSPDHGVLTGCYPRSRAADLSAAVLSEIAWCRYRGRSYTLHLRQPARIAEIIIVKDRHGRAVVRVHWGAARMRFENLIQEQESSERLLPNTPRLDGSRTVSARAAHAAAGVDLA
jgi:hypothetical protein